MCMDTCARVIARVRPAAVCGNVFTACVCAAVDLGCVNVELKDVRRIALPALTVSLFSRAEDGKPDRGERPSLKEQSGWVGSTMRQ